MPETTPVAFRGYAGGKRTGLNHAVSLVASRAPITDLPAFGASSCKTQGPHVPALVTGRLSRKHCSTLGLGPLRQRPFVPSDVARAVLLSTQRGLLLVVRATDSEQSATRLAAQME
jgi:hypothetical protein